MPHAHVPIYTNFESFLISTNSDEKEVFFIVPKEFNRSIDSEKNFQNSIFFGSFES